MLSNRQLTSLEESHKSLLVGGCIVSGVFLISFIIAWFAFYPAMVVPLIFSIVYALRYSTLVKTHVYVFSSSIVHLIYYMAAAITALASLLTIFLFAARTYDAGISCFIIALVTSFVQVCVLFAVYYSKLEDVKRARYVNYNNNMSSSDSGSYTPPAPVQYNYAVDPSSSSSSSSSFYSPSQHVSAANSQHQPPPSGGFYQPSSYTPPSALDQAYNAPTIYPPPLQQSSTPMTMMMHLPPHHPHHHHHIVGGQMRHSLNQPPLSSPSTTPPVSAHISLQKDISSTSADTTTTPTTTNNDAVLVSSSTLRPSDDAEL
eukprot:TRINITY_DN1496_c0_g1_i1.p1 TRINITY_DN1496_c0_g1~~TRINITY_DN1496_c0_g1_i1.p1  ORF type:complete len:316 (-),score=113.72 TRINITY_DN1496_c0_g1_i1:47-994(-)